MKKAVIPAILALAFAPLAAHAQFDALLKKGLESLSKQVGEAKPAKSDIRFGSAAEICARITDTPEIAEHAKQIKRAAEQSNTTPERQQLLAKGLDNEARELQSWARKQLVAMDLRDANEYHDERLNQFTASLAECAGTLADSDLKYAILPSAYIVQRFYGSADPRARQSFLQTELGSAKAVFGGQKANHWAMLVAYALPGGAEEIRRIGSDTAKKLAVLNDAESGRREAADAELKRKLAQQKAEEDAKRQAQAEAEAKTAAARKVESDFLKTPDGKLVTAYQYFQIIHVCHESRKGYAAVFVNSDAYAAYKTKIKGIETLLKKDTREKNTDALFALAEQRNRNMDMTGGMGGFHMDVIETINKAAKSNFTSGKQDCDLFSNRFDTLAVDLLGKEPMKKMF